MGIKIVTYGGRLGWFLRKHFSWLTSWAYLESQYLLRQGLFKKYIHWFDAQKDIERGGVQPSLISIETINRCNSTCDFCPANRNAETRPFMKMDDELFKKIIEELHDWGYVGYLNLYLNNEPLMDKQIEERYAYAKQMLPKAKMLFYTNGTLMTKERFMKLVPVIDKMIINNYSENLCLHENLKEIYKLAQKDESIRDKDITIQIRYIHEILTNRAGSAPNNGRKKKQNKVCVMPYTDISIFPNGICGLCCSDVLEKTKLGDVSKENIKDIWNNHEYRKVREIIGKDREDFAFCKGCDFMDAGIRNDFMKSKLENKLGESQCVNSQY